MPLRGAQAVAGSSSAAAAAAASSGRRKPYYSSNEVAEHNVMSDCWVSYFGNVYDLTKLVQENKGEKRCCSERSMATQRQASQLIPCSTVLPSGLLVQPLLKFAGQDITHWFDPKTKEVGETQRGVRAALGSAPVASRGDGVLMSLHSLPVLLLS